MNFKQKLAAYAIGYLTDSDIPDIGMTALTEGMDGDNLVITAGLSKSENAFVLRSYLIKTLEELHLKLPDYSEAIPIIIEYFSDEIISGGIDPYEGFEKLRSAIGFDDMVDDKYDLHAAYGDYIIIWETITDGLYFYDKTKTTKEQYLVEAKQTLIDTLKRRRERLAKSTWRVTHALTFVMLNLVQHLLIAHIGGC